MSGWPWYHHVFNWIIWMCWQVPFFFALPRKLPLWKSLLITFFAFIPYYCAVMLLTNAFSLVRLLIGQFLILLVPVLLLGGKFLTKVLIWVLDFVIALISDMLAVSFTGLADPAFSVENAYTFEVWGYITSFILNVSLLALLCWAAFGLRKKSHKDLRISEMLMFSLFPISQVLLLMYLLSILWGDLHRYQTMRLGIVFLLCVISDICLYLFIRQAFAASVDETKVRLLEEECQKQDRYYTLLAKDYENAAAIREDLALQHETFLRLFEQGCAQDALRVADRLTNNPLEFASLPNCENRVVASFLEHRRQALEHDGIRAMFSVTLPADTGVADPDLICLYGNLLDNAAEACAGIGNPEITLITDYRAPYVCVRMDNSFRQDEKPRKKRDALLDRGLGFHILRQLAEKYDGEFIAGEQNGLFCSSITLKGEKS